MRSFIIATVLISAVIIILRYFVFNSMDIIYSDGLLYYAYLPAIFYHNFDIGFIPQDLLRLSETNHYFIKYPYGVSFLVLPFFILAHIFTYLYGKDLDGFSFYYQIFAVVSSFFWWIIGVLCNYYVLKKFFNKRIALYTIIGITYGTGICYYLIHDIIWAHIFSYSLISVFTAYCVYESKFRRLIYSFCLGLLLGLITVVRNINILVFLVYIFYGATNIKTLKTRMGNMLKPASILMFSAGFLMFAAPMCLYWHKVSGHFIFNTYTPLPSYYLNPNLVWDNEPDEFNWLNPRIWGSLFSLRKGLFVYYPVLIYCIPGLFLLKKYVKDFSLAVIIFLIPVVYLYSAWIGYHAGDSFGNRFYLDYMCIFSIPAACFLKRIFDMKNKPVKFLLIGVYICLIISCLIMAIEVSKQFSYGNGTLFGAYKPVKPEI